MARTAQISVGGCDASQSNGFGWSLLGQPIFRPATAGASGPSSDALQRGRSTPKLSSGSERSPRSQSVHHPQRAEPDPFVTDRERDERVDVGSIRPVWYPDSNLDRLSPFGATSRLALGQDSLETSSRWSTDLHTSGLDAPSPSRPAALGDVTEHKSPRLAEAGGTETGCTGLCPHEGDLDTVQPHLLARCSSPYGLDWTSSGPSVRPWPLGQRLGGEYLGNPPVDRTLDSVLGDAGGSRQHPQSRGHPEPRSHFVGVVARLVWRPRVGDPLLYIRQSPKGARVRSQPSVDSRGGQCGPVGPYNR